jgi:PPOX class probable F420-dependent enzyme
VIGPVRYENRWRKEVLGMETASGAIGFSQLEGERYLSITTFRPDGTAASTPVWFVSDDLSRRVFVATGANTWKVRRIRRDPHVRVAACSARGKSTGAAIDGLARIVEDEPLVRRLQREKYGWQKSLAESVSRLTRFATRRPNEEAVYLEIVPLVASDATLRAA